MTDKSVLATQTKSVGLLSDIIILSVNLSAWT